MVEALAFVVAFFLRAVTDERKEKRKELMQIMGLGSSVWFLSWVLTYLLQLALCCCIWVGLVASWFPTTGFFTVWLVTFIFSASALCFCIMFSSLVSDPQIATLVAL